ncbi:response regulator [Telmatospirillum sp. J64-1]|uniref:response regulator n=1 Tax=Telmatospirillum sp. J64-1 TaxID=2502183 RepID=UPI00115D71D3|nr:response regulator [Telmatospirillum sp. J64-1]
MGEAARIMIVEDEAIVAMLLLDTLEEEGYSVLGPFASVAQASASLGKETPEAAVLDVNLGDEKVYPVADLLAQRNIPFMFITGYGLSGIDPAYRHVPVVQKPYAPDQVLALIRTLLQERAGAES